MNKLTPRFKGYLEGLIDGEGCIGLYKEKTKYGNITYKPEFSIANNDVAILKRIQKALGYGTVALQGKGKKCYAFRLKAGGMRDLLPNLKLFIKEDQRKTMLKVLPILDKRRHGFGRWNKKYKISELNNLYLKLRKRSNE